MPIIRRFNSTPDLESALVTSAGMAMMLWVPVFVPVMLLLGSPRGGFAILLGGFLLAITLYVHPKHRKAIVSGHLVAGCIMIALVGSALVTGGSNGPSLIWMTSIPLVASMLCGYRAGGMWAILSCITLGLFYGTEELGYVFDQDLSQASARILRFAGLIGIFVCISILSIISLTYELEKQSRRQQQRTDELQKHQNELAHASRLSIMGTMSAGIAHELNQPLFSILNYARGCVRRLSNDTEVSIEIKDALEEIAKLSEQSGDIVHRFRGFVTKADTVRVPTQINELISTILKIVGHQAQRQSAKLTTNLDPKLPKVKVDPLQIQQVILNLVLNSLDAVDGLELQEIVITTSYSTKNDVIVSIQDTGGGLQISVDELFEPFVTSKAEGLGMGLAISRSLIDDHGGNLETIPQESGAKFQFTLPLNYSRTS